MTDQLTDELKVQLSPSTISCVMITKRVTLNKSQTATGSFPLLHELAYVLPGSVWQMTTLADMVVLYSLPDFLAMLDK